MSIIEVRDLVKSYNGTPAVNGVSFSVKEGETFGFLGPNGAGKTTTINILCTLLSSDSGSSLVNGFDSMTEPHGVRTSIGLVFQEMTLDNELTAYENLKFHCYLYKMKRALTAQRIDEMLEVVGLSDRKNDLVKKFSGGMKRRLEIARGLLHRPKVLFLDEPTLGLDPQTRRKVWEFIKDLKEREGNTVFMTTHYMDEAEACDRIAIIDRGRIIACDTPENLKLSLRGDTISLETEDDARACDELKAVLGLEPTRIKGGGLSLIVEHGDKVIPRILESLTVEVRTVNLKRPTLDDVFLHMTGREIREEQNMSSNARQPFRR
ncbi:Efflux ABC transporter, ATP-binding protein [hydrothermal vent metagenome]|uniref:Efflux ABC transporter, ATP-binding protein n=1 Tax=hydrothermal vent metagenome TaxID=652676 RepID=A0A3B0R3V2_9ZZZZ